MSLPGLIGSADLAAGAYTNLGTMTNTGIVNVLLVNRNIAATANIRIAIGMGSTPAASDFIEYNYPLGANQPIERGGLSLSVGENIFVYTDTAGVSARAHGVQSS